MPSYKSFCRSLGTTSFRRKELNREIESQLKLLIEFWSLPENSGKSWGNRNTQKDYYDFLVSKGFVVGDAPNKDKDAREKTCGLVDLGLATEDRHITPVGEDLLTIVDKNDFDSNNLLGISKDSYIYLKQLIKMSFKVNDGYVRPFLVMINALCEFGCISYDEFWLLSLAINSETKTFIFDSIKKLRRNETNVNDVIWGILSSMENYQAAESLFLCNTVTESLIMQIGMNRDGERHDRPYFALYNALIDVRNENNNDNALKLFDAVNSVSAGCKPYWKKMLFGETRITRRKIQQLGASFINTTAPVFSINDTEFKKEFFKWMHLVKAKNLLDNYADLNKRVLKTTNAIIFTDNTVKLDIIPHCFFDVVSTKLDEIMFVESEYLHEDLAIKQISNIFDVKQADIVAKARKLYNLVVGGLSDVQDYVERERYSRLDQMIDEKFTDENIIQLMTWFENRNDNDIQALVTSNADVPTIFEYVLAIAWYKISGRQGKILDYMNLSLDADLLPVTHAAGGHEDITYKYDATESYPAHTLLIEATLASSTNQRRMEMEPVSRHLGEYMLAHSDEVAYCLFATTYLHINVIADFRSRKTSFYYSADCKNHVEGMKIIPINTAEIKTIIQRGITYAQLYGTFEEAFQATTTPNLWYEQEIVKRI